MILRGWIALACAGAASLVLASCAKSKSEERRQNREITCAEKTKFLSGGNIVTQKEGAQWVAYNERHERYVLSAHEVNIGKVDANQCGGSSAPVANFYGPGGGDGDGYQNGGYPPYGGYPSNEIPIPPPRGSQLPRWDQQGGYPYPPPCNGPGPGCFPPPMPPQCGGGYCNNGPGGMPPGGMPPGGMPPGGMPPGGMPPGGMPPGGMPPGGMPPGGMPPGGMPPGGMPPGGMPPGGMPPGGMPPGGMPPGGMPPGGMPPGGMPPGQGGVTVYPQFPQQPGYAQQYPPYQQPYPPQGRPGQQPYPPQQGGGYNNGIPQGPPPPQGYGPQLQ